VRLDSDLIVRQMNGAWKVKHPNLKPLHQRAKQLARRFQKITYTWVPRDQNKHADKLANAVLDGRIQQHLGSTRVP
jgi:probable phosphoglycerate mutase